MKIADCRLPIAAAAALLCAALCHASAAEQEAARRLALDLGTRGQHEAAAVEYRRLALWTDDPEAQAGYYWAAAYEYRRAGMTERSEFMLDRAEDRSASVAAPAALLRAENALDEGRAREAEFHITGLLDDEARLDEPARVLLARRLARARLVQGDAAGAARALERSPAPTDEALRALDRYRRGRGRAPWLGGALGTIPGLGYAYSGEFANAVRSLLLNGIFIYGMAHTAEREQWGAFAAISFFELTWYTGSIYGGIDAAQRYNRDRLEACLNEVDGGATVQADMTQIPLVALSFDF